MCLVTKRIFPYKADSEITVYKVFIRHGDRHLYTPFQDKVYCLDKPVSNGGFDKPVVLKDSLFPILSRDDYYDDTLRRIVSKGYMHAYTFRFSAEDMAEYLARKNYVQYFNYGISGMDFSFPVVYECRIPKSSLYFVSHNGMEICSKRIELVGEIYSCEETVYDYAAPKWQK